MNKLKKSIAIQLEKVSKYYKKNGTIIKVLNEIDYCFEYGKLYCIYGKSGVGKTTLIKILGSMIEPSNGNIIIEDVFLKEMSLDEKAILRNKKIGFIFQDFKLIPSFSSLENVMIPIYFEKKIDINKKIRISKNSLSSMGLSDRIHHFPKELSGGEQQRVAIARALINNPDIILADEPIGSLDKESSRYVLNVLRNLADNGKCVIVVSHDNIVQEYSDVILTLESCGLKVGDQNN